MLRSALVPYALVLCLVPFTAAAQQGAVYVPMAAQTTEAAAVKKAEEDLKKAEETLKKAKEALEKVANGSGWYPFLSVGVNISLGQSSSVVGRPDGTTVGFGATVSGRLDYRKGPDEWINKLGFQLQQTRTPLVDAFVKTLDQFKVESTYLRSFTSVGFYGGITFETALFGGEDSRTTPTDYVIKELNGTLRTDRSTNLLLTKELSPTLLTVGTGLNLKLLDRKEGKISFKLGVAVVEAFVRSGLVIVDDAATPAVELNRLEDYFQLGVQAKFEATGALNGWMAYSFTLDSLFPFYSNPEHGKAETDLISFDLSFKLGFKMAKWASLDYVLGVRRLPLLIDAIQVWNGLLVSFAFTVVE